MAVNRKPLTNEQINAVIENLPIRELLDAKSKNSVDGVQTATEKIFSVMYEKLESMGHTGWEAEFAADQIQRKLGSL